MTLQTELRAYAAFLNFEFGGFIVFASVIFFSLILKGVQYRAGYDVMNTNFDDVHTMAVQTMIMADRKPAYSDDGPSKDQ